MHRELITPTFIISSVRSGSTLLRAILGGHSELHAPHETHLGDIKVSFETRQVATSMDKLGHDERDLRFLLWDALLSGEVARHGKKYLVNKTPGDVESARRELPGLTVRYEDLTAAPSAVVQEICAFLGVAWEAEMLDYGRAGTDSFEPRLGDWLGKIRSGRIHRDHAPPPPVPDPLKEIGLAWGYMRA